jgi:hypothetical protein
MEGSYIEDLANHGGPELCVGVPQGCSEALARGVRRRAIELRNVLSVGCRHVPSRRKAIPLAALSRAVSGPHGVREPVHVCDLSMLENRESPRLPVLVDDAPPFMGRGVAGRWGYGSYGKG